MKEITEGRILRTINSPEDLKALDTEALKELCGELRRYIIDVLSENPGHLASSLGTVELTVALHYLFDVPEDTLVWDVGHQAYAHKVLTGRRESFRNIRKMNGLSGFPKMSESKYDCFGVGHATTSISSTLAMAIADKLKGEHHSHIAVIGDGSMTGGMAFEALNQAGMSDADMLVILNDNGISIDRRVGAMSQYLTHITSSHAYNRLKNKVWNAVGGEGKEYNRHRTFFKRMLYGIKSFFTVRGNFFEALNIRYFGPIDGHDIEKLISTIEKLKNIPGPKLLHIITTKGKGLALAENNPTVYHAPGLFNADTGEIEKSGSDRPMPLKFSDVFGRSIIELAEKDDRIVAITPAMLTGSSLNGMKARFPERTFDVGIAEEHAVTFSAGLAARGIKPFCCIYSSFLQRGFDQVIHDTALQNLPVVFCIDRAGLVGEDGATHHGVFDISYLNMIPNMIVSAPLDEVEMRNLMLTALSSDKPFAIRYPRGRGYITDWQQPYEKVKIGKAVEMHKGEKTALLFTGAIGNEAIKAQKELLSQGIDCGLYYFRFVKPLDEEMLKDIFSSYDNIITIEDGVKKGGFGWAVENYACQRGYKGRIEVLGIDDRFIEQGTLGELRNCCHIDCQWIKRTVESIFQS